jgi:hypothetical protein
VPEEDIDTICNWVALETDTNLYEALEKSKSGVEDTISMELGKLESAQEGEKAKVSAQAVAEKHERGLDKEKADPKEIEKVDKKYQPALEAITRRYAKEKKKLAASLRAGAGVVDVWPSIRAYVRCIAPDAEVDPLHYENVCPYCNYKHDTVFQGKNQVEEFKEYNQICHNCGKVLIACYVCTCPLCNGGNSKPARRISTPAEADAVWELTPRIWGIYEDLEHYPAIPKPKGAVDTWVEDYKKQCAPEFRYHMICPICLYEWYVVFWFPEAFSGIKHLCPCGEEMVKMPSRFDRDDGAVLWKCPNPGCNAGKLPDTVHKI